MHPNTDNKFQIVDCMRFKIHYKILRTYIVIKQIYLMNNTVFFFLGLGFGLVPEIRH